MRITSTFRIVRLVTLAAVASLALAVFVRAGQKNRKDNYAALEEVPQKACARVNPMEHDPEAAAAGRKLFERYCADCHTDTGWRKRKASNLRAAEVQEATPGALFWIVTNGVVWRGMPVWSKLPEVQRWQIVTYLKSLGPRQPASSNSTSSTTVSRF